MGTGSARWAAIQPGLAVAAGLGLAGIGLAVVCVVLARDRARLVERVRGLEDQLEAYRTLEDEMARWHSEWSEEKRALIRARREARIEAIRASEASQPGDAELVPQHLGEQAR